MKKTCMVSGEVFEVTESDLAFYDTISPIIGGEKYQVPPPKLAPRERQRNRLAFRNLRHLYQRQCDFSGKSIISPYPPESPHTVYHADIWWSDQWDGCEHGREFDFNRTFFEQFLELYREVPVINHYVINSENCEYINGAANCRNCYLCFDLDYCENSYYLTDAKHVLSSVDCLGLTRCELCYQCVDCENCYALSYSTRCSGCSDSFFLSDCRQCKNCIGCCNLVNKEYYVFNEKRTRGEFEEHKKRLGSLEAVLEIEDVSKKFHLKLPKKYYFGHANEAFSGNNIQHAKNSYNCFESFELENCKHCAYVFQANNCQDYDIFGDHSQWIYQCQATGINCTNDICCMFCWGGSSYNLYCHLISACSFCFGCSGLKQKKYCVLNKQHSKEEYEKLVPRIIEHMQKTGEWGEFFPPSTSPYPYNETVGYEYHPLEKEEALRRGYLWKDQEEGEFKPQTCTVADEIEQVSEAITEEILACGACGKNYKIIPQELKFYGTGNIPIPKECPECRHKNRRERRLPRQLWVRQCAKCNREIETAYAPQRPEIVYCEPCYQDEVY